MLNSHTLWLQEPGRARPVLFGDSYVLFPPSLTSALGADAKTHSDPVRRRRRRSGSVPSDCPGLVPWRRPGRLSLLPPVGLSVVAPPQGSFGLVSLPAPSLESAALVVIPATETGIVPFGGEPVVLRGDGFVEAEVVDAEVLPAAASDDPAGPAALPPWTTALVTRPASAATGIVPSGHQAFDAGAGAGGAEEEHDVYESFNSFSPRRQHKIKFTCKRCGATSIRPINIHAWREGSVFARCGRCHVTHKLIDNLRLFHEMAGPVFDTPAPPLDPSVQLPPGLRLNLDELLSDGGSGGVAGFGGFGDWSPPSGTGRPA